MNNVNLSSPQKRLLIFIILILGTVLVGAIHPGLGAIFFFGFIIGLVVWNWDKFNFSGF